MIWRANKGELTRRERANQDFVEILTDVAWQYGFTVKNVFPEDSFLRNGDNEYYWEDWDGKEPVVFVDWERHKFKVYGCPEEVKNQFGEDLYVAIETWKMDHGYEYDEEVIDVF